MTVISRAAAVTLPRRAAASRALKAFRGGRLRLRMYRYAPSDMETHAIRTLSGLTELVRTLQNIIWAHHFIRQPAPA